MRRLHEGGRIDRSRPMEFIFDGKALAGYRGDTLASALLANGFGLVGRSFKYHRPRGIYSAGPEEPNALVTVGARGRREPNLPATTVELADGLVAESQNRWPSLKFDIQSVNGLFAPFLSAGFYYKTFMGPTRRAWMVYEHFIRNAAGLGRAGEEPDPDRYEVRNLFADVAVIGAGPAGLSAALAAGEAGAKVVLVEQDFLAGGTLLSEPADGEARAWLSVTLARLAHMPNVSMMTRTTAFGAYDSNVLGLVERHGSGTADPAKGEARQMVALLRAKTMVYATGSIERPLTFANNDRPGIMLASAARTYLNRFAVLAGTRVMVATDNDSAYSAAFDLAAAGAEVTIADGRAEPTHERLEQSRHWGIAVRRKSLISNALGRHAVRAVTLSEPGGTITLKCDLVVVSGGWSPTVHLTCHLGVRPVYREDIKDFVPGKLGAGQFVAGAVTGGFITAGAIEEGHRAGAEAAAFCGATKSVQPPFSLDLAEINAGPNGSHFVTSPRSGPLPHFVGGKDGSPARRPQDSLPTRSGERWFGNRKAELTKGKAFIDLQMDVTVSDVALAHREGYESVEHLKRYTTLGMGADQGKTSNVIAISAMAGLRGMAVPDVGTTTFRPPYTPVAVGALAGRSQRHLYKPFRRTPMHDWHVANGAQMLETGVWMRPSFYLASGRDVDQAYPAEMRMVREAAGLMDISTLGKIDVQGPDAAEFLDRVYVNGFAKLPIGRARYGIMLRDDGIVFDDGTTMRLSERHFFMTTSTAKAADVMSRLEFLLDTAWPGLRVSVTSVTDEWAAMSVAGPTSREILAAAFPDLNVSNEALPHMGFLEGRYRDKPLRIIRLSFSGERAYEIYTGASVGKEMWCRLIEAGTPFGQKPYGVEALGALRVEKGHVAGPEIDGRTTLDDLGLSRMAGKRSGYVGDVLGRREALSDPARPRLVGLRCLEPGKRLSGGAILFRPGERMHGHGLGRITSVTYSPTLDASVGLALIARNAAEEGAEIVAAYPMKGQTVRARIVSPIFLDPKGERLHG
ncbi:MULTISPECIES: sarcosine oxidase subunit alpha family protein [unclassified Mesorhizobium]|uniref:sarcosine oxidase subunit alpha family protein n=2 Tax=Mesorhizobium TaxID=68287 RepID=UPI000FCB4423|nr:MULTISPECIES: sarcosine oxidase subunit alpha family protein [unclassified Mesorhizobium]RVD30881.1 sarcosine oxidase subunit alpha family protein [Mesorhizobium sp. M4B.F.Ca.ET.017.02.2.1]RWB85511.1 MAG: sarcosine oxidase subunit alpha family protein [Mesorhizobium sp.]RWC97685.1 MAG: sarcosine oxidase subunit alpha family protein [Mesorhizobium sp.]TGQ09142.1 sarcosine oxidase subunit alpha family protein [Mesorhizobium sp. M4B.F.Ca.ET.215.01.1.1]TGQ25718.1 sarcosine oxidase subunit alpha